MLTAAAAIVVALLGLAGAVYTARAPAKASPYAAIADRVVALERQVERLEKQRADDQTEIAGLQRRVLGVIRDRDDLVRYITVLREWIASGARPPAPAVPIHLADVLPAWIPVDGAELPTRLDIEHTD